MIPDSTANWSAAERAAFETKRRSRNMALGLVLVVLVILFFGITVVRMAPGMANGQKSKTGPQIGSPAAGPKS